MTIYFRKNFNSFIIKQSLLTLKVFFTSRRHGPFFPVKGMCDEISLGIFSSFTQFRKIKIWAYCRCTFSYYTLVVYYQNFNIQNFPCEKYFSCVFPFHYYDVISFHRFENILNNIVTKSTHIIWKYFLEIWL